MDDETYWKERKEEENREKQKKRDDDAFLGYKRQQEDQARYNQAKKEGGCYIATAIYEDYNHPKVVVLRQYRDEVLSKSFFGQRLIKFYYKFSPVLIKTSLFKTLLYYPTKLILDILIRILTSFGRH